MLSLAYVACFCRKLEDTVVFSVHMFAFWEG